MLTTKPQVPVSPPFTIIHNRQLSVLQHCITSPNSPPCALCCILNICNYLCYTNETTQNYDGSRSRFIRFKPINYLSYMIITNQVKLYSLIATN